MHTRKAESDGARKSAAKFILVFMAAAAREDFVFKMKLVLHSYCRGSMNWNKSTVPHAEGRKAEINLPKLFSAELPEFAPRHAGDPYKMEICARPPAA